MHGLLISGGNILRYSNLFRCFGSILTGIYEVVFFISMSIFEWTLAIHAFLFIRNISTSQARLKLPDFENLFQKITGFLS